MSTPVVEKAAVHAYQVQVKLKEQFSDGEGLRVLSLLHGFGLAAVKNVSSYKRYQISGPLTAVQIQKAAKEVLSDSVTQEFRLLSETVSPLSGANAWLIEVWFKKSVTDPVEESVIAAFQDIGLPTPHSVRVISSYVIDVFCGRSLMEKIISRALVNPLIHEFSILKGMG